MEGTDGPSAPGQPAPEVKECGCVVTKTPRGEQVKPCVPCAVALASQSLQQAARLLNVVAQNLGSDAEQARAQYSQARAAAEKAKIDAALRGG